MKFPVLTIGIVLIFIRCSENKFDEKAWNNPFPSQASKSHLALIGRKSFFLDSTTALAYPIVQYVGGRDYFVVFSPYNATFIIYDYSTGTLVKKIALTGQRGIGRFENSFSYSFYFIGPDSLLLYNDGSASLFLIDSGANIVRSYSLKPKDRSFSQPSILTGELLSFSAGSVYFTASSGRNVYDTKPPLRDNLIVRFDLSTGKIALFLRYPPLYRQANWGRHLYTVYKDINPVKGLIAVSYPIDHYIYTFDLQGKILGKYYAGSNFLEHVNPVSFETGLIKPDVDGESANFVGQRTYSRLVYDKYVNVYYRFVTNAIIDSGGAKRSTPFSIIILDSNFNKIGEQEFKNSEYFQGEMFVSRDGLCMDRMDSNDDTLKYDVFKLVR